MVGACAIEADAVINLAKRRVDGVDVATVTVQPIEPFEAVSREALRPIHHRGDHGGGAQRYGPCEGHVVLRLADIEGRRHQNSRLIAGTLADDFRAKRIGAEQPVRAVLFCRADGNENGLRGFQIFVDFRPGGEMKLHIVRSGSVVCRGGTMP